MEGGNTSRVSPIDGAVRDRPTGMRVSEWKVWGRCCMGVKNVWQVSIVREMCVKIGMK